MATLSLLRFPTRLPRVLSTRNFTSSRSSQFLSRSLPYLSGLPIDISEEVKQAQAQGQAIVALESTLITHGQFQTSLTPFHALQLISHSSVSRSTTTSFIISPQRMRSDLTFTKGDSSNNRNLVRSDQSWFDFERSRGASRERLGG